MGIFQRCMTTVALTLCLLLAAAGVSAASLEAEVDRETVIDGESVVLYITGSEVGAKPDTSPLLSDFTIIHSGISSSQQVINGVTTWGYKMRLELQAKKTGSLAIPSFTVDGVSSDPIAIQVVPRGTPGVEPRDKVFVELSVDKDTPYVQEHVILSLKVFDDGKLDNIDHVLQGNSDYRLEQIPSGDEEIITRDGEQMRVRNYRYALFPQKSGELVIESFAIPARVVDKNYGGNYIFRNVTTRRIELRTEPLTLQVKPRAAAGTSGWWLPVEELQLQHQWSEDISNAKVGEAYTLTLDLIALGATATQLPEIMVPDVEGLKIYADAPEFRAGFERNNVVSLRREKWSVIPNANGEVSLPALSVKWWDTVNDKEQLATLPPQQFSVTGGANVPAAAPQPTAGIAQSAAGLTNESAALAQTDESLEAVQSPQSPDTNTVQPQQGYVASWWQWLAIAAMFVWACTLFVWWWTTRQKTSHPQTESSNESRAWRRVKSASTQHDPSVYSAAVLEWGRSRWSQVHNLPSIGTQLGSETVRNHMVHLDAMRFSPDDMHTSLPLGEIQRELEYAVKHESKSRSALSANPLPQL